MDSLPLCCAATRWRTCLSQIGFLGFKGFVFGEKAQKRFGRIFSQIGRKHSTKKMASKIVKHFAIVKNLALFRPLLYDTGMEVLFQL